jgi:hypothetical protein
MSSSKTDGSWTSWLKPFNYYSSIRTIKLAITSAKIVLSHFIINLALRARQSKERIWSHNTAPLIFLSDINTSKGYPFI